MKVLVSGATGFIGSHLVEWLLAHDMDVAVLLRPQSNTWRLEKILGRLHTVRGSMEYLDCCRDDIARFGPDVVFHLAWTGVGNTHRNDDDQVEHNIVPTVCLARLTRELGARSFVGLGSHAEYGPCTEAIHEAMPTKPITLYGAAKLSAYHLCGATLRSSAVRFAWVRVFSIYGPRDNSEWMITYLIKKLLNRERPALTRGEQLWDYLYVTDAVEAIGCIGLSDGAEGIFNLGSGQAVPLRSIVEMIRDAIDPGLPLGFGEVPYRPDQVMHLQADITRLKDLLGWKPMVSFRDGLQYTLEWLQES